MTPDEASGRLGLRVTTVRAHPAGHVATTPDGEYLVTETVARRYVPDVDDQAGEVEDATDETLPRRPPAKRGR